MLDAVFSGEVLSPSRIQLATGLSLTIVGLPLWAFHWRLINRQVRTLPVETRSILRKLYMYLVLGVSMALTVGAAIGALEWLFGVQRFRGWSLAAIVVFGVVWAFHWRIESAEGRPSPETVAVRRLYLYFAAAGLLITS